ncbi:putative leucine-rich repeat-containing protein DDB_G0290503 isoform X2 [Uranotaenia lowii]|uniref:putative leucine-rich repeat-containing protein DDB_G0290503 isoform X2 n=1 Tax=Uranotaenia lowii TaxID=190385 RepID=UPI00247AC9EB|nr:putative leucine-rich repeat-containing protein DDB_G0290503 isoform X2 [Uranotaenia lowii]
MKRLQFFGSFEAVRFEKKNILTIANMKVPGIIFLSWCILAASSANGTRSKGQPQNVLDNQQSGNDIDVRNRTSNGLDGERTDNDVGGNNTEEQNTASAVSADERNSVASTEAPEISEENGPHNNTTPINTTQTTENSREGRANWKPTRRPDHICRARNQEYDCQFENILFRGDHPIYFGQQNGGKKISITKSELNNLPKSFFDAFPEMESANLESLKINYIEPKAFQNAGKLQNLFIRKNRLRQIEGGAFQGAQSLKMIMATENEIESIDPDALNVLPNLQQLYIGRNKLKNLPILGSNGELLKIGAAANQINLIEDDQFSNNYKIQEIFLKENQISHFDLRQLNNKQNLTKVDVSYNRMTTLFIPNYIKVLSAKNNSITSITHHGQSSIEKLDLSNNELIEVPQLTAEELQSLDLSNNRIEMLDFRVFSKMPKLTQLNVKDNKLFELNSLRAPTSITELNLSNNKLIYAPKDCKSLENVQQLYLDHNDLVHFCNFDTLKNVKQVSLSKNNWDCTKINIEYSVIITDTDSRNACKTGAFLNARNICCRNFRRPYNEIYNELLTNTKDSEYSNQEELKRSCLKQTSSHTNGNNLNHVKNEINKQAQSADKASQKHGQAMQQKQSEIYRINQETSQLEDIHRQTNETLRQLKLEIDKQRSKYGVIKQGLQDPQDELTRVVKFVKERNTFKQSLIGERDQEIKQHENKKEDLSDEIEEKKIKIEALKKEIRDKKDAIKAKKADTKLLDKKLKANAPAIHGRTGTVTK